VVRVPQHQQRAKFQMRQTDDATPRATTLVPMVVEQTNRGERAYDIYSRLLIHQPWMSGLSGQATDIDIHAKEIIRTRAALNKLLASHTGQAVEKIERDVERDFIMTAEQAKAYGIVDEIISKHR